MIGTFTAVDLIKYTASLLKEARLHEMKSMESNYGWLKSKHMKQDCEVYLEELRPMILKMSPESCTAVAVKLDILTENSTSIDHVITTLKTLLREQDSMIVMAATVKRTKETKLRKVKVHPVLDGREPTVSFVVHYNKA